MIYAMTLYITHLAWCFQRSESWRNRSSNFLSPMTRPLKCDHWQISPGLWLVQVMRSCHLFLSSIEFFLFLRKLLTNVSILGPFLQCEVAGILVVSNCLKIVPNLSKILCIWSRTAEVPTVPKQIYRQDVTSDFCFEISDQIKLKQEFMEQHTC